MDSLWYTFKKFFINYFWLGIILIVISMFIKEVTCLYYWVLFSKFIETIGMAIFVASLFSFTFESVSFQNRMQDIVEKIVLKRTFLNNLSRDKKKEALHSLLKPTDAEIEKYSNIEDFYEYFVKEVLDVSQRNVRSNYSINIRAKYDVESSSVYTDGIYSYRLYPSENGYSDILVGFLKDDEKSSVDAIINLPNGKREKYSYNDLKEKFKTTEVYKTTNIKVNDFCSEFNHVDVELRVKEYGHNHWLNVFFKAEQATDGFKFTLYCEEDITIKTYNLFDVGHNYHVDISEDKQEIHIACHQWINEGSGISLIVSKPDQT